MTSRTERMRWTPLVQARVLAIISERVPAGGRWVCVGDLALGLGERLAELGHDVTFVAPARTRRQLGSAAPIAAESGVRRLRDQCADNVLLAERRYLPASRRDALRETFRVLRSGGTIVAVAPGRLSGVCVERLGMTPDPPLPGALDPDEFDIELRQAGFAHGEILGSDGFFSFAGDVEGRVGDLYSRAALLAVLRRLEQELAIVGTSSWLVGVAIRASRDVTAADVNAAASYSTGSEPPVASAGPAAPTKSGVPEVDAMMAAYYESGVEQGRLESTNLLEFERTKVILTQRLPPSGRVLDVGGGPGMYAAWLAGRGHEVSLVDPIPLHVQQARQTSLDGPSFEVRLGDARRLAFADESADAVVMMGPLFHLVGRDDRISALREAFRVLRPGGVLAASAMGRMFLLGHAVAADTIRSRAERERVLSVAFTGFRLDPPVPFPAYAHRPRQLAEEIQAAGFTVVEIVAIEGFFHLLSDLRSRMAEPAARAALLELLGRLEADPAIVAASGHIMGVAVR